MALAQIYYSPLSNGQVLVSWAVGMKVEARLDWDRGSLVSMVVDYLYAIAPAVALCAGRRAGVILVFIDIHVRRLSWDITLQEVFFF